MRTMLCRVVWADEYKSKGESFYAGNMKYPAKNKIAHELLNFSNENGFVYGFVENSGGWMNLEKLGASSDADQVDSRDHCLVRFGQRHQKIARRRLV